MKRIISIILLLSVCVSATWATRAHSAAPETDSARRVGFALEASLSAGLNTFMQRGAQASVLCGMQFGQYISVAGGIGLRHAYTLVSVDANILGYGEPDQRTYGDRFLLPLFVRVQGGVPAGRFGWSGAEFVPFARLDVGYAVDLQESAHRQTASGPFVIPAAGLDIKLQDGSKWTFSLGVGIHAAQYVVVDHAGRSASGVQSESRATGKAVSLGFTLGRRF